MKDLKDHLNILNLSLQGLKPVITAMYNCVQSFKCKLFLCSKQLANGNLAHFKALQSVDKIDAECSEEYRNLISTLHEDLTDDFRILMRLKKNSNSSLLYSQLMLNV